MWHFVLLFLVVSTSAIDCLERLVSEMTSYVSSGMLNPTHSCFCQTLTQQCPCYKTVCMSVSLTCHYCECCGRCSWKMKSKKQERDAEKHRKNAEMTELRCVELERELDELKAQRNSNIQQFEQLKKQFTDILVGLMACLSVDPN